LVPTPLDRRGQANLNAVNENLGCTPERAFTRRLGPIYNIKIINDFSPMQNISLLTLLMITFSFF
jgi:hypothetical protein